MGFLGCGRSSALKGIVIGIVVIVFIVLTISTESEAATVTSRATKPRGNDVRRKADKRAPASKPRPYQSARGVRRQPKPNPRTAKPAQTPSVPRSARPWPNLGPSQAQVPSRPQTNPSQPFSLGPQFPVQGGGTPAGVGLAPVLVMWDPRLRRYVILRNVDPRMLGMGGQHGGSAFGLMPVLSPSPFLPRPGYGGTNPFGQNPFQSWQGQSQGQRPLQPWQGQGQSQGQGVNGILDRLGIEPSRNGAGGASPYRPSGQSQTGSGYNYRRPQYPPPNDPPVITCPDDLEVVAEEGKVTATITWAEPQAEDQEDGQLQATLVTSLGPGSEFPVGTHEVQYQALDSQGASIRCSFFVKVTVTLCPAIPRIPHLQHDCLVSGIIFGKLCNFRCMAGFQLTGEPTLKCTEKGVFDHDFPQCTRRKCPMLKLPTGGVYFHCSDNNQYGSLCFVQCDRQKGFSAPYGSDATRCGPNGEWLGTVTCRDEEPPHFTSCPHSGVTQYADVGASFANVTWEPPEAIDNSAEVNITQVRGEPPGTAMRLGEHHVVYMAEDAAGNRAVCSFRVLVLLRSCSLPAWAADPHMSVTCDNDLMHGSSCNVQCRLGRQLQGSPRVSCQLDESGQTMFWKMNDGEPKCTDPQADTSGGCQDPLPPRNAYYSCTRSILGERVCHMGCQHGYDLPRTMAPTDLVNTCNLDQGWSQRSPLPCLPLRRPEQLALPVEARFRGRCGGPQDASRLQLQFDHFLSNSRYQQACPIPGTCGHQNLRCSCQNEMAPSPYESPRLLPPGLPFLQLHFVPILFHWDFVTDFHVPPAQPPQPAVQQHSDLLRGLAAEIEKEMEDVFSEAQLLEDSQEPGLGLGEDGEPGLQDAMVFESFGFEDVMIVCPDGLEPAPDTVSCRSCPPGMFIHEDGGCQSCQVGTYQDGEAGPVCKSCPPGTSTASTGTSREEDCQPQRDNSYLPAMPTRAPLIASATTPDDVTPRSDDSNGVTEPDTESDKDAASPGAKGDDSPGSDDSDYYVDPNYYTEGQDYSENPDSEDPSESEAQQPSPDDPAQPDDNADPTGNDDDSDSQSETPAPSDPATADDAKDAENPDDPAAESPESENPDAETPEDARTPGSNSPTADDNTPEENSDPDAVTPADITEAPDASSPAKQDEKPGQEANLNAKVEDTTAPAQKATEAPSDEVTTAGEGEGSGEVAGVTEVREERRIFNPWANLPPISFANNNNPPPRGGPNTRQGRRSRRELPPELWTFVSGHVVTDEDAFLPSRPILQ